MYQASIVNKVNIRGQNGVGDEKTEGKPVVS